MGTVSFTGVGSGIDWNLIIQAEIAARTSRVITPLENWKDSWETKIATFDELRTYLTDLRDSVEAMDTAEELRSYQAQSSSTSTVEAAVSGNATPGTYSLEINQLANAELEIHSGLDAADAVVNDSGGDLVFAYSYAGESVSVDVADGTTLQELAALVNNDSDNPGVTASVLDDGSGGATSHHLVLRGNDTGATYTIAIDGATTLTGFGDTDFTEVQAAQNAQVRLNGYPAAGWLERESNVVADLITGVTLTLQATTSGSPVTVAVNTDSEGVKAKIQALVESYNALKTWLNVKTSYNTETEQGGELLGNYAANLVESMLREVIISEAPGFLDGTDAYTHLGQVGLETLGRTDDDTALGTIELDEDELDAALAEDFEAVIRLFADSFRGYSDSDYLTFHQASGLLTTPGIYDVEADFDGGGNLTAGRFKLTTESTFRSATVDSPYIVGTEGNPEYSLYVKAVWDGGSTTQTATVRVTQGIAGRLGDVLDQILDSSEGMLHNLDESYRDIVAQLDDRIEQEQDRLELLRERLVAKYARLEEMIVTLQAQQDWASQLAASLTQQS
ncbi:MAG: hypothetical protein AMK73_09895 [Planctomycetes bacterium SM23_32]|nr:MAG: hypothetical protein AMK73_09895 [Planctomycetes bacterium SM23_32]